VSRLRGSWWTELRFCQYLIVPLGCWRNHRWQHLTRTIRQASNARELMILDGGPGSADPGEEAEQFRTGYSGPSRIVRYRATDDWSHCGE
jgi:hypothetical protein